MKRYLLLAAGTALVGLSTSQAQVIVYDTVTPNPSAGYGEVNDNNPIFGDALNLSQAGQLQQLRFDLFNTTTGGNSGTIQTGTMDIEIYDNTIPYSGGSLSGSNPLLASLNFSLDFSGGGGLPARALHQSRASRVRGRATGAHGRRRAPPRRPPPGPPDRRRRRGRRNG